MNKDVFENSDSFRGTCEIRSPFISEALTVGYELGNYLFNHY